MKIIENNWNQSKEVVYKGSTLIVPIWADWVVVDADNKIVAFETKPIIDGLTEDEVWWIAGDFDSEIMIVGGAEFEANEDWKQSLEYVGE